MNIDLIAKTIFGMMGKLPIIAKKIFDVLDKIFGKSQTSGNNNTVNINACNNTNCIININNINITLKEQNNPVEMKNADYIEQDALVSVNNYSGKLYLHIQAEPLCVNLGKFYSCTVNEKTLTFWIGVEALEEEEYSKIYIKESNIIQQGLKLPNTICEANSKDGVFNIKINKYLSVCKSDEDMETTMRKILENFLKDIFC
jgi:hypothetical protein